MRNLIEVEGLVVVGDELRRVRMQRLLDHHQFQQQRYRDRRFHRPSFSV